MATQSIANNISLSLLNQISAILALVAGFHLLFSACKVAAQKTTEIAI